MQQASRLKEFRAIRDLTLTEGWTFLRQFIERRMAEAGRRLLDTDASEVSQIAQAQGFVKACREILNHVDFCVKGAEPGGEA